MYEIHIAIALNALINIKLIDFYFSFLLVNFSLHFSMSLFYFYFVCLTRLFGSQEQNKIVSMKTHSFNFYYFIFSAFDFFFFHSGKTFVEQQQRNFSFIVLKLTIYLFNFNVLLNIFFVDVFR